MPFPILWEETGASPAQQVLGNELGNKSFKKPQRLPKSPANGSERVVVVFFCGIK